MHGATWDAARVKLRLVEAYRGIKGRVVQADVGLLTAIDDECADDVGFLQLCMWVLEQHGFADEWGPALLRITRMMSDGESIPEYCQGMGISDKTLYSHADRAACCLAGWLNCVAVLREIDRGCV